MLSELGLGVSFDLSVHDNNTLAILSCCANWYRVDFVHDNAVVNMLPELSVCDS